jgi:hypothetical protein
MPKYRVLEKSLIGNEMFEEGAEVEYDGFPSANLEPLCEAGHAKAAEFVEVNKQRVRDMIEANPFTGSTDTTILGAAIAKAVAESNATLIAEMQLSQLAMVEAVEKLTAKPAK